MVEDGTPDPILERFKMYARAYMGRTISHIGAEEWT